MEQIVTDNGKIKCIITGKLRKETPEEYVRQEYCRMLLDVYKYPKKNIDVEFSINIGRDTKRIDIVVFNSDKKTQSNVYIAIETKKKDESDGKKQLESYVNATTANFGVWTNGDEILYLEKTIGQANDLHEIPDIPKFGESIDVIGKYTKDDLVPCTDLKGIFTKCNNYFRTNWGSTSDKRFSEILKILFCKTEDEKNYEVNECEFYITTKEKDSEEGIKQFRKRIDKLFDNVKDRYKEDNIFNKHDTLMLNDRSLSFAVAEFQKFSLIETEADIKGLAFETFVGSSFRGELGEFFTPIEIVKMTVEMLMPKINETVCDPACGSGGFLVMVLKHMISKFNNIASSKKKISAETLYRDYADKYIRGIDFNPDLARVAKMNMVLNDDGHSGIFHMNSLTPFEKWDQKVLDKISPNSIDIILTNPPFGKKCVVDQQKILETFDLGKKWKKDDKKWIKSDKFADTRTPDILFIERCLDLLKPGGRMGIVLPDGILGNDGFESVRQFILERSHLVAIIDCPVESFLPSVDTKTSLIILKKKLNPQETQTFDVFMAIAKVCGHDRRGKPLYQRNDNGDILFDNGKPIIDNDFKMITKRFIEHVETRNIYN
jgi:type I restriction enzyme M protein